MNSTFEQEIRVRFIKCTLNIQYYLPQAIGEDTNQGIQRTLQNWVTTIEGSCGMRQNTLNVSCYAPITFKFSHLIEK